MKRKVLAVAVMCSLCLGMFAGCGSDGADTQEASGDKGSIYFVSGISGGAMFGPCQEGFEEACKELGYEANWVAPTTVANASEMVQLCENALSDGAEAIVLLPVEEEAFVDVLTRAKESGLAVVTCNGTMSQDYSDAWIGTDPEGCGIAQAEAVMNEFEPEDEINLVYLQSYLTSVTQNEGYDAMVKELRDNGYKVNVKDEWRGECKGDMTIGADLISAMMKASPEINCVVMSDGGGSIGVKSYIEENGKGDLVLIGMDDEPPTLNAVKDGTFNSTVIQNFREMGYESAYLCDKILTGEDYEYDNDSGSSILYADEVDAHAEEVGIELE